MEKQETPRYTSTPTRKSIGNVYSIYDDRIELRCRFLFFNTTLVVKKDDLISIDIFKPPVIKTTFWALKLDLADLSEHVGIKKKKGVFKQLRFTPHDPQEFVSKAQLIFKLSADRSTE